MNSEAQPFYAGDTSCTDTGQALINLSMLNALAAQSGSQLFSTPASASPMLSQLAGSHLKANSAANSLLGGNSPSLLSTATAAGNSMNSLLSANGNGASCMAPAAMAAGLQGYPMFCQGLMSSKSGLVPESPRGSPLVTPSSSGQSHLMNSIRELSHLRSTASPLQSPIESQSMGQSLGQSLGSLGSPLGSNTSVTSALFAGAMATQALPGGWMQMADPEGRQFYYNVQTWKAQWDHPVS